MTLNYYIINFGAIGIRLRCINRSVSYCEYNIAIWSWCRVFYRGSV